MTCDMSITSMSIPAVRMAKATDIRVAITRSPPTALRAWGERDKDKDGRESDKDGHRAQETRDTDDDQKW